MRRKRPAFSLSLNSQKVFPERSEPGLGQCSLEAIYKPVDGMGATGPADRDIPTRKDLRQGSRRLFHLNQRLLIGLIGATAKVVEGDWGGAMESDGGGG